MASGEFTIDIDRADLMAALKTLSNLSEFDRREIVAKALKDGGQVIMNQAKRNMMANGHVKTGALRKSAGTTIIRKSGELKVHGGYKKTKHRPNNKSIGGAAAHLLDRGTTDRYTRKGAYRGRVRATLFALVAFRMKKDEASRKVMKTIDNVVKAIWQRTGV